MGEENVEILNSCRKITEVGIGYLKEALQTKTSLQGVSLYFSS